MARYWRDYWKRYSPMDFKRIAFFLAIIVLVFVTVIYSTQYKPASQVEAPITSPQPEIQPKIETPVEVTQTIPTALKGNLIIAVKDVKQKLAGLGDATELLITIKSAQVHATKDPIENKSVVASGWITIFEGEKSFDLLQFTNNIALIGEKELEPGNYTQIRLYVSSARIKIYSLDFAIYNKTYPMYIPSNALKVVRPFTVQANKTTVLTLDFDVPRMVSRTSEGYTLGPTIKSITDEIKVIEQSVAIGEKPKNAVDV